jgi:hypothetical protein
MGWNPLPLSLYPYNTDISDFKDINDNIMKKIVDYDLVSSIYRPNIVKDVSEKIKDGWQPFGNLILGIDDHGNKTYTQPMVKYEENNDTIDLELSHQTVLNWINKYLKSDNKKQLND